MMRQPKFNLCILFSFCTTLVFAQKKDKPFEDLGVNPVYFLDSVSIEKNSLLNVNVRNITSMQILSRGEAIASLGITGKNGAVYMETIPFATKRYQRFFKAKSPEYAALLKNIT